MSGTTTPGSPPPEVPEEFAAAYRAAYEQALAAQTSGPTHRDDVDRINPDTEDDETSDAPEDDTDELPVRQGPLRIGTHRSSYADETYDSPPTWTERITSSRWFVPLLLAILALLLIVGAYSIGRKFAGRVASDSTSKTQPRVVLGEGKADQPTTAGAWSGKVTQLGGITATASCTAKPGVDSSGAAVSYAAKNVTDGEPGTTWRCNGPAIGEKITLDLGKDVPIGQVGIIPGYAKTDPQSKVDRYAENNRITRLRWTIGDRQLVQTLSGSAKDRSLELVRIPRTTTDRISLQILAVAKGPRDTTAISEVQVGQAG